MRIELWLPGQTGIWSFRVTFLGGKEVLPSFKELPER
jgi:hypothetical protein